MRPGELCGLAVSDLNLLRNLAISPLLAEHLSGYTAAQA